MTLLVVSYVLIFNLFWDVCLVHESVLSVVLGYKQIYIYLMDDSGCQREETKERQHNDNQN